MKTSKKFWKVQALVLVIAVFGLIQISSTLSGQIHQEGPSEVKASNTNYTASGSSKNSNNSLYYLYWKILKQRSKKHKA